MLRFFGFVIMGNHEFIHHLATEYAKGNMEGVDSALRAMVRGESKGGHKRDRDVIITRNSRHAKLTLVKERDKP